MRTRYHLRDHLPPITEFPTVGTVALIAPFHFEPGTRLLPATIVSWGSENVSTTLLTPPRPVFGEPPPNPYRPFRRRDLFSLDGQSFLLTEERIQQLRRLPFRSTRPLLDALDMIVGRLEAVA